MTAKQKAARARFKSAIAEAKKLRAKNPKLSQAQAVKQAWAILYSKDKPAKKVGSVKKKAVMKKYIIQDSEAGNFIESFETLKDAQNKLNKFEESDKKNEIFVPNFYEIKILKQWKKKKAAVKKAAPKKRAAAKKISEKAILNKIHTVKKNVERLDEAQHTHMMGKIVKSMIKKYVVIYNLPGKVSMVEFVTATSLPEAKKIASAFKKHHKIKGTTKVTLHHN